MKFVALITQRESNIRAALGEINKLSTLADGVAQLESDIVAEKHIDLPIKFSTLSMSEYDATIQAELSDDNVRFQYTRHALSQAVVRIKPDGVIGMAGYLAVCPPDLRATNFNFWHNESYGSEAKYITKNDVMLRTRFGEDQMPIIRAVVSQSYVPIDDLPLMSQFLKVVPDGAHVRNARGDLKSRFDVIWPTMKKVLIRGEPLFVAVRLVNSETGVSSVRLEPMVYSTQSRSSIIIPANNADISIRHIGEAGDRLAKRFVSVMGTIDPFIEMLNSSYSDLIVDHFHSLDQVKECVKKAFQIPDSTMKRLANNMLHTETRADIIDALSRTGDGMSIEEGEELQRAAGLLTVKGWNILKKFIEDTNS